MSLSQTGRGSVRGECRAAGEEMVCDGGRPSSCPSPWKGEGRIMRGGYIPVI